MPTIDIDEKRESVRRLGNGTVIDLEGLAIGAMLDRALRELQGRGVPAAMISTDGIHAAFWPEGEASPFEVELKGRGPDGRPVTVADVRMTAPAFAYVYPREVFVADDGTEIHEWIDPRTGRPVNDVTAAGIFAQRAMVAAPLAAAAFVSGDETPRMALLRPGVQWVLSTDASGERSSEGLWVRWRSGASD